MYDQSNTRHSTRQSSTTTPRIGPRSRSLQGLPEILNLERQLDQRENWPVFFNSAVESPQLTTRAAGAVVCMRVPPNAVETLDMLLERCCSAHPTALAFLLEAWHGHSAQRVLALPIESFFPVAAAVHRREHEAQIIEMEIPASNGKGSITWGIQLQRWHWTEGDLVAIERFVTKLKESF